MVTLGIDLAAEPKNTAACRIDWAYGEVGWVRDHSTAEPLTNERLLGWMHDDEIEYVGIDAPFGWPTRFVEAVAQWSDHGRWQPPWDLSTRRELRLRTTDRLIKKRPKQPRDPLSVSADSIANVRDARARCSTYPLAR